MDEGGDCVRKGEGERGVVVCFASKSRMFGFVWRWGVLRCVMGV